VIGYNSAGRPITRSLSTNGVVTGVDTTNYDTSGRISGITAASGVGHNFNYDGLLDTGESWTGALVGSTTRTYDNILRLTTEAINGANQISIVYDNDELITSAGALSITRDAQHGLPTTTSLGVVTTATEYNEFGEEISYSSNANATPLHNVAFTRDKLGRLTQKIETMDGITDTYTYGYDLVGRLVTVNQNGAQIENYAYDENGNRTSATVNGVNVSATYDTQDRLLQYGSASYTYGPAGDLFSKTVDGQTTTYHYDQIGNLVSATLPGGTSVSYVIDGRDRRVGKKINGVLIQQFLYSDSLRPAAELDGAGNLVSRFVYADRGNVPVYLEKAGVKYSIISDRVGSVRLVVNTTTGAVVQRMGYDSFGNVIQDTNPGFQPFGFAGGLYDRDTKLVRFGARDYDTVTGRWTAKDPLLFNFEDINSFGLIGRNGKVWTESNLYNYTWSDPINYIDPLGLAGGSSDESPPPPFGCDPKRQTCVPFKCLIDESLCEAPPPPYPLDLCGELILPGLLKWPRNPNPFPLLNR
jgi:RHS repeat-associated protein